MSPLLPDVAATLAVVRLGEDGEPIAEIDRLSSRAVPARRDSFVAGRRAARRAIAARLGGLPSRLRVEPDPLGCPVIHVDGQRAALCLSISHAGGYAIAAVGDAPVGIDLIELERLPAAMVDDTFAPGELLSLSRALASPDAILAHCLAFAAKECALKWLGVGMRVPLRAVQVFVESPLSGPYPWRACARVEHPTGSAKLTLYAWPLIGTLWAALLVEGESSASASLIR